MKHGERQAEQFKLIFSETVDRFSFQDFRQIDNCNRFEWAALGADAAASAEFFIYSGLSVCRIGSDAFLAHAVDRTDLGAEIVAAPYWLAFLSFNDGDTGHV